MKGYINIYEDSPGHFICGPVWWKRHHAKEGSEPGWSRVATIEVEFEIGSGLEDTEQRFIRKEYGLKPWSLDQ